MAANAMSTRAAIRLVLVVLLTTSSVLLALWLLYSLQALVVWIILALFLTIALSPVVDWFTRHRVPRAEAPSEGVEKVVRAGVARLCVGKHRVMA